MSWDTAAVRIIYSFFSTMKAGDQYAVTVREINTGLLSEHRPPGCEWMDYLFIFRPGQCQEVSTSCYSGLVVSAFTPPSSIHKLREPYISCRNSEHVQAAEAGPAACRRQMSVPCDVLLAELLLRLVSFCSPFPSWEIFERLFKWFLWETKHHNVHGRRTACVDQT